jgi:hypothetical protein
MAWPSGDRLRAVMNMRRRANGNGNGAGSQGHGLENSDLVYVFLFVKNPAETQRFYKDALGLTDLEGGPCSSGTAADSDGVIKYDTGGLLLTTHRIYEERTDAQVDEHMCPPNVLRDGWMQTVAPVLHVKDLTGIARQMSEKYPDLAPKVTSLDIGLIGRLEDPSGHRIFLYEPSEQALRAPSGAKLQELIAEDLASAAVLAGSSVSASVSASVPA